jgi:hypothetical protein
MSLLSRLFKSQSRASAALPRVAPVEPTPDAPPLEFTWLNKQGVRSNRGFEVQFTGRFEAVYREGDAKITVYVEPGLIGNSPSVSVSKSAFERWDNSSYKNNPERQAEIMSNFRAAIEFQGLILDV